MQPLQRLDTRAPLLERSAALSLGSTSIATWGFAAGSLIVPTAPVEGRVLLHLIRRGRLSLHSSDDAPQSVSSVLRAGRAFFTRSSQDTTFAAFADGDAVTLAVPAELFPDRSRFALDGPVPVRSDATLLAPISDFIARALEIEKTDLSAVSHYYLERMLQEMAVALSAECGGARGAAMAPDVYAQALTIISAHATDADITTTSVAADVNLSIRQLERVFREHGTSVGREIRRARVEQAVRLLRDRTFDALGVDQIAGYCGFSNGSSLARAMRAEGEMPPARIRAKR